ncbi:MAG: 30S ribosomal protein S3 [Thermoplasmatales archaeon]|nr:30S ribosomal protein S3 [Thermoplasmatales archaeon]
MAIERKFVEESQKRVLLKEFIKKECERAGFGGVKIQRIPMGTLITLQVERPGLIIGRGGKRINEVTNIIKEKFGVENPQIEIEDIGGKALLNATLMAQKVADSLERGWHFRRVGHSTVRRVVEAGARGCQVVISGKLTGERHRSEKFTLGYVKYCGEVAKRVMDEAIADAKTKPGIIGVKVRLMKPDVELPDIVKIVEEGREILKREMEAAKAEREEKLEKLEKIDIMNLPEIPSNVIASLKKSGIRNARELYEMDINDLIEIKGIGIKRAERIKEILKEVLEKDEGERNKENEQGREN